MPTRIMLRISYASTPDTGDSTLCARFAPPLRAQRGNGALLAEIDPDGLNLHVVLKRGFAGLPADARLLEATERDLGVELIVAVHPDGRTENGIEDAPSRNRTHCGPQSAIPGDKWFGKLKRHDHVQPFDSTAYFRDHRHVSKLSPRYSKGTLLGYQEGTHSYLIWDGDKVIVTHDVLFPTIQLVGTTFKIAGTGLHQLNCTRQRRTRGLNILRISSQDLKSIASKLRPAKLAGTPLCALSPRFRPCRRY